MEAGNTEEVEEEPDKTYIKEKNPAGKRQVLLQWRNGQVKKKKEQDEEITNENFETEAKRFNRKTNKHAQRKGKDKLLDSSQSNLFSNPKALSESQTYNNQQQEGEEKEYDTNNMWAELEHVLGETPRTAAACMNLAKNAEFKGFRKRRPKKQKKAKRTFRSECRKRSSSKDSSLAFPEQEGDYGEEKGNGCIDDRQLFSPYMEYCPKNSKPLRKIFERFSYNLSNSPSERDIQEIDAKADIKAERWVYNVLTIPDYRDSPELYCTTNDPSTPSPPLEAKPSEERFETSRWTNEAILEFGKDDVDQESRPFMGEPEESLDIIQTLPNVVPRHEYDGFPIYRSHCINNEPETGRIASQGMMGLSKLIRRSNSAYTKDQVQPFSWPVDQPYYLNGGYERSMEEQIYMLDEDQLTTFNALFDRMELL